ncbi:MAG TPA: hypothetical protein VFD64_08055 [Gemmatimonadaceae bacterium]|nr:hypothetical protein [Gemmatimonadaceae bacterium]
MTPLHAIRLAMMGGVLLFGGVSWFLTQSPDWTAPEPGIGDQLNRIARIAWIVVSVALIVMFMKFREPHDIARASSVAILAWALGEMLALLGGVVYFLTSMPGWYIAGVIVLTVAFVAFPPPPALKH